MPNLEQARFMQGDLGRKLDDAQDHSEIAPRNPKTPHDKALHRAWYKDPGSADIVGVDTKGLTPTPPKPPGTKTPKPPKTPTSVKTDKGTVFVNEGNNVTWAVIGGTKKMRDDVVKNAQHNFNKAERQNFDRVVIQIGKGDSASRGAAGYYQNAIKYSNSKPVRDVVEKFPQPNDPRLKSHKKRIDELKARVDAGRWQTKRIYQDGRIAYSRTSQDAADSNLLFWKNKPGVLTASIIRPDESKELTPKETSELRASQILVNDIENQFHFIKLGRRYYDGGTPTHELIHHLRMSRPSENFSGHVPRYAGKDKDLEESTTDLETIGRHNPWVAGPKGATPGKLGRPTRSGYYHKLAEDAVKNKKPNNVEEARMLGGTYAKYQTTSELAQALENQDRALLVHGKNNKKLTDKQIKLALAKVQKEPKKYINAGIKSPPLPVRLDNRYKQTLIAELGKNNIGGKQERVDRYFAALDPQGKETTKLHMKGAGQAKNAPAAKRILSTTPGKGIIVEYHDGKAKKIGKFENPKQRNGFTNKRRNRFN